MPIVHGFDPPERFVAGTVGPPGQRTFFLQARAGARLVSVALEKQQVVVLAQRMDELLDEVMASEQATTVIPAVAPLGLTDTEPLEQPIEEEFRAGTMTLSWDPADQRVVVEVFPIQEITVTGDEPGDDPGAGSGERAGRTGDGLPDELAAELADELGEEIVEQLAEQLGALGDDEDDQPEPDEVLLVRLEPGQARAFVARSEVVVEAGRPSCPFCAQPVDPGGHLCVRANGFKRRDP